MTEALNVLEMEHIAAQSQGTYAAPWAGTREDAMMIEMEEITEALDDFDLEKLDRLFDDASRDGENRIIYEMLKRILANTNHS